MSFRQILKMLLYVAVFFLIVLIATIIFFSTAWSTSGKCSNSCQRISNSVKGGVEDHPDESWADIPEEFYSFFTPPPRFLYQGQETNETAKRNNCRNMLPPIGYVFRIEEDEYKTIGHAAVLVRKWVLMRNYLLIHTSNKSHTYVRFNSISPIKGGEVIRVLRISYFKLLASLYLEHPIYSDCIPFASLLIDSNPINTFTMFFADRPWLLARHVLENETITDKNLFTMGGENHCAPGFILPNNTYYLCAFMKCDWDDVNMTLFIQNNELYRTWIESL